ncbi:MAG: DNA cytosine methyltransferase, partial [Syntrophales bacterium]|nr:DNA cytosine methyltransferase [Syntrophales bacterium]
MENYSLKKMKNSLFREEIRIYEARTGGVTRKKRYKIIDVFSGAGGMTLGFSKRFGHVFEPIWANDFDEDCVRTYNANFGNHCIHGDIQDILTDSRAEIPEADVVIGGPPCQGFSLLNKKRYCDQRKELWRPYLEVV